MVKRIAAALLWFYVVWAAWNALILITGWSEFLGPVVAAAFAAVIAGDPRGIIWKPARQTDKARAVAKARLEELPSLH